MRAATAAVIAIAVAAMWPTWLSLARVWLDSETYSHGWLIAAVVAAWTASRVRAMSDTTFAAASWLAWPALALSVVIWLIAFKAHSEIGQQIVVPAIIWLAVATAFGVVPAVPLRAPLAYFYVAVPIWDVLLPTLQGVATWFVETVLAGVGVPAYIEGTFVHLSAGTFEVAEGCAGLRYLLVALSTAAVLAAARGFDAARTAMFLVFTAALAIAMNWVRIVVVILAGHSTDMQHYLVSREHVSFGWLLFAVTLGVVVFLGTRVMRTSSKTTRCESSAPTRAHALAKAAVVATLVLMPLAVALTPRGNPAVGGSVALPRISGEWNGPSAAVSGWKPSFVGASASAWGAYYSGSRVVEVYVFEYATQEPGRELVQSGNSVWNADWAARDTGSWWFDEGLNQATRTVEAPDGGRWVVSYFYSVGGVRTGSGALAQLVYGVLSWIDETPVGVRVAAYRCDESCGDAAELVSTLFIAANYFDGALERP